MSNRKKTLFLIIALLLGVIVYALLFYCLPAWTIETLEDKSGEAYRLSKGILLIFSAIYLVAFDLLSYLFAKKIGWKLCYLPSIILFLLIPSIHSIAFPNATDFGASEMLVTGLTLLSVVLFISVDNRSKKPLETEKKPLKLWQRLLIALAFAAAFFAIRSAMIWLTYLLELISWSPLSLTCLFWSAAMLSEFGWALLYIVLPLVALSLFGKEKKQQWFISLGIGVGLLASTAAFPVYGWDVDLWTPIAQCIIVAVECGVLPLLYRGISYLKEEPAR